MFECRRCGFCCQLDVKVNEQDIKRIKRTGRRNFTVKKEGETFLRHKDNSCIFFKDGLCSIYPIRPNVCAQFPFEKDGSISPKCQWREDFSSDVEKRIVELVKKEKSSSNNNHNN